MISKDKVIALAEERIEELNSGIFLVEVNISPTNVITIELDKEQGGVTIDECVSVSRNVEHNLDRETEDFELSVSSAGMDRPLRVPQQFKKNIGNEVRVVLNHGSVQGELMSYDGKKLIVQTSTKEKIEGRKKKELVTRQHEVDLGDVKEVKRVISFGNPKKK
ncbi:ribosome assembly cofactor RimP [Parvicella tangerina]|uniref:Ribosome maturation factor RimP n=1 Tax=Parvicella tangerina TaxID=2829795 RepID=A0A916JPN3_9FLAO|nr:ribosome assembly cofactor RimP [Parvicella tangerina]CAG5085747.1 Ribosome maturation factor RimP [Parvicella tangerina]